MNIAIVGFGVEGKATASYFLAREATITVCDKNSDVPLPEGVHSQLGEHYLENLDRFDAIFRSAGIHPKVILEKNPNVQEKITTATNKFFRVCPTKNIIGVTGTKGKGTSSTLIAEMLKAAGRDVFLGGNIGLSPFDFLDKLNTSSWVVLELSSFQLSDIRYSPHIGVCLMVVPEHLNWHKDMDDYVAAKSNIFAHQSPEDIAVYFSENDNSKKIASRSPGQKIPYFASPGAEVKNGTITISDISICDISELRLLGTHNWQNVCAAVTAVWQATQNVKAIRSVLTNFSGLEHRLEFVREVNGVKYYNDSFGTTPETAIVAIQAFQEPKVIILGGSDKQSSYDELAKTVAASNVRRAILIGEMGETIAAALHAYGYDEVVFGGTSMPEIVQTAKNASCPGDVVLLSPACASFDMFENYKDRGNQFKQAVNSF
jgi:UDP-N-acetylmuramoylalanine--D-glutamate ligase